MLKAKELNKMSVEDLRRKKDDLSMELVTVKLQRNMGSNANKKAVKNMRHDIARINTALNAKLQAGRNN